MTNEHNANMNNGDNKGSIWRKWDLHIHSPATYSGEYSMFISNLGNSVADVIGINDYCTIKGYEEVINLGGVPNKVLFPVVEFRMHNLLQTKRNPNGVRINFHIIFDNDSSVFTKIKNWLSSLKCFDEKGESIQLGNVSDTSKVSFDFEQVINSLKEYKLYQTHALIWLPYDEYGGIDEINPISDGSFKLSLINKSHIIGSSTKNQIDFFKWENSKFTPDKYKDWFDKPKPCIKGSDAHKINYPFGCLMNHKSEPIDKYCWINADATFNGLKQILIEPNRVFIGDEPDLLKRVKNNQTKFIQSLVVNKVKDDKVDDVWFNNFRVELNSSLVAIIGKKGSGKSAITDIIGLCGNTHQDPSNFSFLTKNKFRKIKPYNLSEKFEATLSWQDGTSNTKKLNENPNNSNPERVKYIPQNFLERLCTNVESDDFEKELKQIIYSHTPSDKRFGKTSLDELINYKSDLVNAGIAEIKTEMSRLNSEIIFLEEKSTDDYQKSIKNELELKENEIKTHESIRPKKPHEAGKKEESTEISQKLTKLREKILESEKGIRKLKDKKKELISKREKLVHSKQFYKELNKKLKKIKSSSNEQVLILTSNEIDASEVFKYKINTSQITSKLKIIEEEIKSVIGSLNVEKKDSEVSKLEVLKEDLTRSQDDLDKSGKEQQKYLDDLKNWETRKNEIEGSEDFKGTLRYLENHLSYLKNQLIEELETKKKERKKLVKKLYSKKLELVEIRRELFQPVMQFINEFKDLKERYDVKIDVSLELKSFSDNFFRHLNQGRAGTFCGKEEGYKRLTDVVEKIQFNIGKDFTQFTEELVDSLLYDKRYPENPRMKIKDQLKKGIEPSQFYDFIHHADFLQPTYNLKLGNKTLKELSPGERGALLLIFYLILDNDDIPLIIDQPEENLDNESVYHILVHFIKKVKEKRQIIIVTHNPNLAIVCDADQIINMQIEKDNKNTVTFLSGAIENDSINKKIINILEGTLPAFNNRDSKYLR